MEPVSLATANSVTPSVYSFESISIRIQLWDSTNSETARIYAKLEPSGKPPTRLTLPRKTPSIQEWEAALAHQCDLRIQPSEAWETVVGAWEKASHLDSVALSLRTI